MCAPVERESHQSDEVSFDWLKRRLNLGPLTCLARAQPLSLTLRPVFSCFVNRIEQLLLLFIWREVLVSCGEQQEELSLVTLLLCDVAERKRFSGFPLPICPVVNPSLCGHPLSGPVDAQDDP